MAKVLIADAAEFMRVRISKMLVKSGFDVDLAETGLKAVEKFRLARPDITLMEISMPEMDGLTALKHIRRIDPRAKVIMLTALGQESFVLEAIKSGARDFLVKPFEAERVLNAVNKLLA